MKKRIYISGKISGLDLSEAQKNFEEAEKALEEMGYAPVNPLKVAPYEEGKTWEQYMIEDIVALAGCDGIYMLENWKDSQGAMVEHGFAMGAKKNIMYQGAQVMIKDGVPEVLISADDARRISASSTENLATQVMNISQKIHWAAANAKHEISVNVPLALVDVIADWLQSKGCGYKITAKHITGEIVISWYNK